MTRIFTFLAALMLAAAGAVAETVTASGTIVTKPVSLPSQSIYELRTQTAIDIEYTQSATVKAELEAPANLFEYIKIEASNSVLSVRYKDNTQIRNSKKTPKLRISAPSVRTFRTNSAGDIKIMTDLTNSSTIQLIVNSAGDISISGINATSLKATSGSSGDISLSGNCQNAVLTASSASSIMAGSLKTLIVNASCQSSSSSITCHALERCEASVVKGASFKNTASGATVIK